MCHFLPVYHLGIAFLGRGEGSKYNTSTPGQGGPESDGNKGVFRIPQSSSITETSQLDCLVSYPRRLLRESFLSEEMQSVNSISSVDWASIFEKVCNNSLYPVYALVTKDLRFLIYSNNRNNQSVWHAKHATLQYSFTIECRDLALIRHFFNANTMKDLCGNIDMDDILLFLREIKSFQKL